MWFVEMMLNALPFWRASEDAGLALYFDRKAASLYLEGWMDERTKK